MATLIAPSILDVDFSRLGEEVLDLEASGADWIHLDVMDGIFVPNISFGLPIVSSIRRRTPLTLDTHLMIAHPLLYAKRFIDAGSDVITLHAEAEDDIAECIAIVKANGAKVGLALKPATPLACITPFLGSVDLVLVMSVEPGFGGQAFMPRALEKIRALSRLRSAKGFDYLIEVDGGVNNKNAPLCIASGADVLVAGSYIVKSAQRAQAIRSLR